MFFFVLFSAVLSNNNFVCGLAVMVWLRNYLINVHVVLRSIREENGVILDPTRNQHRPNNSLSLARNSLDRTTLQELHFVADLF